MLTSSCGNHLAWLLSKASTKARVEIISTWSIIGTFLFPGGVGGVGGIFKAKLGVDAPSHLALNS